MGLPVPGYSVPAYVEENICHLRLNLAVTKGNPEHSGCLSNDRVHSVQQSSARRQTTLNSTQIRRQYNFSTQLRPLSGTYGPLLNAKHSKDIFLHRTTAQFHSLRNSIFTCFFFFFFYFIAKPKQTPFRGIKIKLDSLHKPPTSPVS